MVVSSLLCLASCSPARVRDHLSYVPIVEPQDKKHISLAVEEFEDKRSNSKTIGDLKDVLGITLAEVTTTQSVPLWMMNAFKTELSNAGYLVVEPSSTESYSVKGKILKVFNRTRFKRDSCIVIDLALKRDQEIVFQKTYETHSNGQIECSEGDKKWTEYATPGEGFKYNLQEICKEFTADVNKHLLAP